MAPRTTYEKILADLWRWNDDLVPAFGNGPWFAIGAFVVWTIGLSILNKRIGPSTAPALSP